MTIRTGMVDVPDWKQKLLGLRQASGRDSAPLCCLHEAEHSILANLDNFYILTIPLHAIFILACAVLLIAALIGFLNDLAVLEL